VLRQCFTPGRKLREWVYWDSRKLGKRLAATARSDGLVNQSIFGPELPKDGNFIDASLIGDAARCRTAIAIPGIDTCGCTQELVTSFHLGGEINVRWWKDASMYLHLILSSQMPFQLYVMLTINRL
jgi:hypothetical protein